MTRETVLFCIVPTAGVVVGTIVAFFGGQPISEQPLAALIVSLLLGASAVSVFLAHFSRNVSNRFAWGTIFTNGALMILFFALLHSAAGIMCTSPICVGTQAVQFDVANGSVATANLDSRFLSGLYFSVVTFTTLGYGDFQPHPDLRLLAGFEAVLGYIYLGLTVGAAIDLGGRGDRSWKDEGKVTGSPRQQLRWPP